MESPVRQLKTYLPISSGAKMVKSIMLFKAARGVNFTRMASLEVVCKCYMQRTDECEPL